LREGHTILTNPNNPSERERRRRRRRRTP